MLYKTLKHKTLKGTFGVFVDEGEEGPEIAHSEIPDLRPYTCTMESMTKHLEQNPINQTIIEQLKDYDMMVVDIMIVEIE